MRYRDLMRFMLPLAITAVFTLMSAAILSLKMLVN